MDAARKILIVDDHPSMRLMLRTLLEDLGFDHILEAASGRSALDTLRAANDVDFVITDCSMPGMDGIDLLRAIRAERATFRLPVLMVSAEMRSDRVIASHQAGVDGYLVKPFDARTLRDAMLRILDRLAATPAA